MNRLLFIGDSRDIEWYPIDLNAEDLAKLISEIGFNWQHLPGISGFIRRGQKKLYAYFSIEDENIVVRRDFLGEYLDLAHRYGVKIFLYLNVHWYPEGFKESHPEWLQKRIDGTFKTGLYDLPESVTPCMNSNWRNWIIDVSMRIARKYDVDGIFLDGPVFFEDTCYCNFCREKALKEYGLDLYRMDEWTSKEYTRFMEFKYNSLKEFLRDFRDAVHSINPNIMVYMNGGHPRANWIHGRDVSTQIDVQDLIGAEGGFIGGRLIDPDNNFHRTSITSKFLEAASLGKSSVVFSDIAYKPWSAYPLTSPEIRLLLASIISNGSSPHFVYHYPILKDVYRDVLRDEIRFFRNIEGLGETFSLANTAIVFSQRTADIYFDIDIPLDLNIFSIKKRNKRGFIYSLYGACEILYRLHIPFDLINERTLVENRLEKYDVLVLPNIAFMNDIVARNIERFIEKGGRIYSSMTTSLYNEYGRFRGNFALKNVLKLNYIELDENPFYDYIYLPDEKKYIPTMPYKVKVENIGCNIYGYFIEKRRGVYNPIEGYKDPAILYNNKSIYFSGNYFQTYWRNRFPEYLQIFNKFYPWETLKLGFKNLPGSVEVEFRGNETSIYIFLINYSGGMERPIREVIPIKNIEVCLNNISVEKIYAHKSGKKLDFIETNKGIRFKLDYLKEYEIIEIVKK